ncbi:dihydrolipoyl dehydrogenase [Acetohalobium arabaticum]|uniref:Dihydrolipoyl dehydrogenase n=1 Tax=Acetohalobium arabaticum (strain ATCC 49924 / DSM 5501 / Z-7288) TaxID=574087 RepID=D9QVC3_ACEAZ|nr:dihydrolipoyl dehydrogenase [Acetohalobium arabaticum]ADL12182.1 dihydrolipoamide dehydrogenase [Acetohalobium arabaticum DSM 5501]
MLIKLDPEQLPEDADQAKITEICVQPGENIKPETVIMQLEADKTSISLTSKKSGTIKKILVTEDEEIEVQQPLVKIASKPIPIKLSTEQLPNDTEEAQVTNLPLKTGDKVTAGEVICELEADKTTITLESKQSGTIAEIKIAEEDTVQTGETLLTITPAQQETKDKQDIKSTSSSETETEITVIGGGPGGYVAALKAAKLGADVTLIEKEKLGGTCLNWGCIPTKALVRSAQVYTNLKEAEEFGCQAENIDFNWESILERKENIVTKLTQGIEQLLTTHEIKVISGTAQLKDETTVEVTTADEEVIVNTEQMIIATGSQPVQLPIIDDKAVDHLLYSRQALDLDELPEKMVIIGGGVIGLEFAFIFSRLDVEVTVIEYLDEVLSFLDSDITEEITQAAQTEGIDIYTSAQAKQITSTADDQCLVKFEYQNSEQYITADRALMAVGRKPDLGGLEVEKLGIELDKETDGIQVNDRMQTTIDNIYAIGDVTGKTQLAHAASHQGIVAVKNIMDQPEKMDYNTIPTAIFTKPEIASVGMTEKEAAKADHTVKIGKFPVAANGKALTLGETTGFVKIIADAKTDQVLGGAIIGPHATDLIAEITLAVNNQLTTEEVIETIHAHPTSAETIHEAALAVRPEGALHYDE